jgi:hypothetical protein
MQMKNGIKAALLFGGCTFLFIRLVQMHAADHSRLIFNQLNGLFASSGPIVQAQLDSRSTYFFREAKVYAHDYTKRGITNTKAIILDMKRVDSLFLLALKRPTDVALHIAIDAAINTTIDSMKSRLGSDIEQRYLEGNPIFTGGSRLFHSIAMIKSVSPALEVRAHHAAFQLFQSEILQDYWNRFRGSHSIELDSGVPIVEFDSDCFKVGQPIPYVVAQAKYHHQSERIEISINGKPQKVKENRSRFEVEKWKAGSYPLNIQMNFYKEDTDSLVRHLERIFVLHVDE